MNFSEVLKVKSSWLDFSKSHRQLMIIEAVRIGFYLSILLVTIVLQSMQSQFVNYDMVWPVYMTLFAAFSLHTFYIYKFDKTKYPEVYKALLFGADAIFVTLFIYNTGVGYSIFLFLYLLNIILAGLVFHKAGGLILASWTSILFSFVLILEPHLKGQALFLTLGLNNLAFFAVAFLAGYLGEQLNVMGVTLTKQSRDLKTLHDMNKSIVDHVGTGMMMIDPKGSILHCNPEGQKILALDFEDLLGESVKDVFPNVLHFIEARHWETGSREVQRLEFDLKNADENEIIVEVLISPVWSEEKSEGYILLFQDLTRVRKLEFAMRQSEKLAAVGQLAAGIAHEIRNPLASISGSIQLMDSLEEGSEERMKLKAIVSREIDRLNDLISEFLDFVRPAEPVRDRIELAKLLGDILDMVKLNDKVRPDIVQKRVLNSEKSILGDASKLKQAFLNIFINACQAMEKTEAPEMIVELEEKEQSLRLSIRDNGCGMNEANRKRIFEPFHTTKAKGTGLGLAVTHKILESHQAEVFVKSEVDVGTEFILEFPIAGEVQNESKQDKTLEDKVENIDDRKRGSG